LYCREIFKDTFVQGWLREKAQERGDIFRYNPPDTPLEKMDARRLKGEILARGADLCGIAPADRFSRAPKGFHPTDIYKDCRSVVVYAKSVPHASLHATSSVPYTYVSSLVTQEVDALTLAVVRFLQDNDIGAVPIPSDDPYESWDPVRSRGQAILSLRHAGYFAGLGVLGKNTLLINKTYGNMIQLGAVLLDIPLDGDPMVTEEMCARVCRRCLDACPVKALNGTTVDQHLCRPLSNFKTEKGYILKKCHLCRSVCPQCTQGK
jgi:epoxyqueuosine reductase